LNNLPPYGAQDKSRQGTAEEPKLKVDGIERETRKAVFLSV
jgi:hypothetical protein